MQREAKPVFNCKAKWRGVGSAMLVGTCRFYSPPLCEHESRLAGPVFEHGRIERRSLAGILQGVVVGRGVVNLSEMSL